MRQWCMLYTFVHLLQRPRSPQTIPCHIAPTSIASQTVWLALACLFCWNLSPHYSIRPSSDYIFLWCRTMTYRSRGRSLIEVVLVSEFTVCKVGCCVKFHPITLLYFKFSDTIHFFPLLLHPGGLLRRFLSRIYHSPLYR